MENIYYTIRDAAKELGISRYGLLNIIHNRDVPLAKAGKYVFINGDVLELIKRNRKYFNGSDPKPKERRQDRVQKAVSGSNLNDNS
jgi:hypothetical protein